MTPDLGGGSGLVGTTASMPRQAVTDEPADREIDLGLAHQPSVTHDPEQKPASMSRTAACGSMPGRPLSEQ
jgi:hypothetical protein